MKNTKKENGQNDEGKAGFQTLLKKSVESANIARFYGFHPVCGPKIIKKDIELIREMDSSWHPREKVALLRELGEARGISLPQPIMLFMERPFNGTGERKNLKRLECELTILNSYKSVTEALLIQASRAILENIGYRNTSIRLN